MVFPFFPVGRAKLLGQRDLDAAHISPGEICGLTLPNNLLLSVPSVASVVKLFCIVPDLGDRCLSLLALCVLRG